MMRPDCQTLLRSAPRHVLLLSSVAACVALAGCGEEPAPVVVAPPPPPPAPVVEAPKVASIAELMAQHDIDPRVNLPEDRAPRTTEQRVAVLKFFDAFARGNADALKPMMSPPDQFELDRLVETGAFKASTEPITRIDVRCGRAGDECALAVFHVGEEFQPQLWTYVVRGDAGEFDAIATPPGIMEKLSGNDWIAAWQAIVAAELAKADEPDEVLEIPQQDFTQEEAASSEGGSPGVETPSAPGGAPGKRPPGNPIKPPKAPGFGTN